MIKTKSHISQSMIEKMRKILSSNASERLNFLRSLARFETPSNDPQSQQAIFIFLENRLEKLGFYTLRVPGQRTGGYLYARPKLRKKEQTIQLLIGHCDTVWPIGTLKNMKINSSDGKLSGPGIYDMKAGLTQIVFALDLIRQLNLDPEFTPVVLINSDEEIGSRESGKRIASLSKIAQRAFILEPPLGHHGKLKTARKGLGRFNLLIRGKAAHAGLNPEGGASAIMELSHQVQQLFAMNDPVKGVSVNVGMIEGGISPNVIAPSSKAVIDVRVLTQKDAEEITQKILNLKPKIPETTIEVTGQFGRPPMEKTEANQRLWLLAKTIGTQIGLNLEESTAGGGSDGNTTSLYTATLDGLGTTGDGAHAAHEFIYKDKLTERTLLLTLLILTGKIN